VNVSQVLGDVAGGIGRFIIFKDGREREGKERAQARP
jgi:hypothetical protein